MQHHQYFSWQPAFCMNRLVSCYAKFLTAAGPVVHVMKDEGSGYAITATFWKRQERGCQFIQLWQRSVACLDPVTCFKSWLDFTMWPSPTRSCVWRCISRHAAKKRQFTINGFRTCSVSIADSLEHKMFRPCLSHAAVYVFRFIWIIVHLRMHNISVLSNTVVLFAA